ncbi:MAG: PEGA domain-containing protein [Candidatus Omnitrophota bacterium]|jgi:hypothetical protein
MQDKKYLILRRIFFWLFSLGFIVFAPLALFYSLGYKFDTHSRHFQKTGAISIKASPQQARIFLDGNKISESAPYAIRGLLPGHYTVKLEKEGFYHYEIPVEVNSSYVYDIDIVLLPKTANIERADPDLKVYKFFVVKRLFNKKIIVFTDDEIYLLDEKLGNAQKIADLKIDPRTINTIEGLEEGNNQLIFWNKRNIWRTEVSQAREEAGNEAALIYSSREPIKDVFIALKGRYLVVHEGIRVVNLDIANPTVFFPVLELKSSFAKVFYDSESEALFVRDNETTTNRQTLFKIYLTEYIDETRSD